MIRILYITPNFSIGGTEGQILNLAVRLDKTKFQPYAISIGFDYGQRAEYKKNNVKAAVFKIFEFVKMINFIRKNKIDIVHSFYYGNFSGWELLISKMAGVKIFITSRRNMGYWRKSRHLLFDMFRNRFTDIIIANSYAVREKTIIDERIPPLKIIVVYNGVDFTRYNRQHLVEQKISLKKEYGLDEKTAVVGMISNIKNIKGYDYFLKASKIMLDKGHKVKFIIAGEGSDESDFKRNIEKHGLADSLISVGLCKDTAKMFSIIDVFMYSSLSEGFPNIILEAMASGKPIVGTDVGGTSEMILDGYSGFLVPPMNAQALAKATIKLLSNEALRKNMSERSMEYAKNFFDVNDCIRQYEETYIDIYKQKTAEVACEKA